MPSSDCLVRGKLLQPVNVGGVIGILINKWKGQVSITSFHKRINDNNNNNNNNNKIAPKESEEWMDVPGRSPCPEESHLDISK